MLPRAFWLLHESQWPRGDDQYVFLAVAVHRVRRYVFPSKPIDIGLKDAGIWRVADPATAAIGLPSEPKRLRTDEEVEEYRKRLAAAVSVETRVHSVWATIANAGADGNLKTAIRPLSGGDIVSLQASVWKTEFHVYRDRFALCQMNPNDPFSGGIAGAGEHRHQWGYIFVGRDDLDCMTGQRSWITGSNEYWKDHRDDPVTHIGGPGPTTSQGSVSVPNLRKWYDGRRAQLGDVIPTERDDILAAKTFFNGVHVTKRKVLDERARYPKARPGPRGRA